VWALGATLYAAVEGHSPYEQRSNPVAVLHDITQDQPPHPQRAAFLEPSLQRMMDRDPDSRWSMDDAEHVLGRLADEHKPEGTLVNTLPNGAPAVVRDVDPKEPRPTARPEKPTSRTTPKAKPVEPRPSVSERPQRRGRTRLVLVAAALLLLLGGGAWFVSQLDEVEQGNDNAGQTSSNSDSGSTKKDEPSDSAPASAAEEKEEFVRSYFEKAPGGTDEAWAMLGPSLKEQGRDSYDSFWQGIESVDLKSVNASKGSNTVDVSLVYRSTDGQVSPERKQEGLISDGDGGYLLDTDTPAE